MQPVASRVGALTAGYWRLFPAVFATAMGMLALTGEMSMAWRLVLALAICAVFLGSFPDSGNRVLLLALGAMEAAIVMAAGRLLSMELALAMLVVLAALQGLHNPGRVAGGVVGFIAAALSGETMELSGFGIALWLLAYGSVAASCAVLHFQARASMRNFRAFGHEFRTPLTNILQNAQMGLRTSPSAAHREYLDNIALAARHMDMLLSNVLDFLKLMTGNYVVNTTDVDIVHLVDNLARLVQPLREQQQVRFHSLAHGPLVQFRTNADALRVSILNLLSNAIKFTQNGRVAVVTSTYRDGGGARLRVRVVDDGIGVSPSVRTRLFSEFTTGEPWNRVQRGTGLGLALVRELVKRQGGEVFYRPREEGGSEFGFEIPVMPADSPELEQTAPGRFVMVSSDEALCRALAARAKQLERVADLESLKGLVAARPDLAAVVVLDARDLTTPIDRAGLELDRICTIPLFAIVDPVEELESIEVGLAFSGFNSLFNARMGTEALADSIAHSASSLIPEAGGHEANVELRSNFSGRVVVVEDDPMQLRYLMLTLGHSGIVAIGASSLAEARSAVFGSNDIRLLIVDYNLPDGNASTLIGEIRQREHASAVPFRLPIAVITAEDRQVAIRDLAGVDFDWFQSKPITDPLRIVRMALKRLEGQETGKAPEAAIEPAPRAGAELSALLAPDFALAAGEALANILADAKEGRWDGVYRHAHKLKGLAALMNERSLHQMCAELKREAPKPANAPAWLKRMEAEVAHAIERAGGTTRARTHA